MAFTDYLNQSVDVIRWVEGGEDNFGQPLVTETTVATLPARVEVASGRVNRDRGEIDFTGYRIFVEPADVKTDDQLDFDPGSGVERLEIRWIDPTPKPDGSWHHYTIYAQKVA